ncbi:MAG TPA: hypothetical protein ENO22_00015 [candidate division Zixibacteria bacterium]|nr:hypothetical protein [candidate division Zixibacteria bacterium]HEQ97711.1 hypothetical protein [candidate division Zixibacteria bacterium]
MGNKYQDRIDRDSGMIMDFLRGPHKHFMQFYKLCFNHTRKHLCSLQRRGAALPQIGSDPEKNLDDVTIDVLGVLLSSASGPYNIVFDYFAKHGINPDKKLDGFLVYHRFTVLIRGFANQELYKIRGYENPQTRKIKRRFKDILKGSGYHESNIGGREFFTLEATQNLREDKPVIPYEKLLQIVENAYHENISYVKWCRKIFEAIDKWGEYQNGIFRHELFQAAIEISSKHMEINFVERNNLSSIELALIRQAVERAIPKTLDWVSENASRGFVEKKRITKEESQLFLKAIELYLRDFGCDGSPDKYPRYYFALFPGNKQDFYLKNHKYPFETMINSARDYFTNLLRNDSTINGIGDY